MLDEGNENTECQQRQDHGSSLRIVPANAYHLSTLGLDRRHLLWRCPRCLRQPALLCSQRSLLFFKQPEAAGGVCITFLRLPLQEGSGLGEVDIAVKSP